MGPHSEIHSNAHLCMHQSSRDGRSLQKTLALLSVGQKSRNLCVVMITIDARIVVDVMCANVVLDVTVGRMANFVRGVMVGHSPESLSATNRGVNLSSRLRVVHRLG